MKKPLLLLRILKWIGISIGALFVLLSLLPYLFTVSKKDLPQGFKPFENSQFSEKEGHLWHFRLFKPEDTIPVKASIVYIHGFAGSTFSWRHNIDTFLSLGYEVLCVDLPAFGYSEKKSIKNYSQWQNARHIKELADSVLVAGKYLSVGHSMGATVAFSLAKLDTNCRGVVGVDGLYSPIQSGFKINLAQFFASYPPLSRWAEVIGYHKLFNIEKFKDLLSSAYSRPADSVEAAGYLEPFTYSRSAAAIFDMFTETAEDTIYIDSLIATPRLYVWGKKDAWIPLKSVSQTIEKYPHVLFDSAGHCPMETHPERFNSELSKFAERVLKD